MAVTSALAFDGINVRAWDITASADGDGSGLIDHGFPDSPILLIFVPLTAAGYAGQWRRNPLSLPTQINVVKSPGSGTGSIVPQVRLWAFQIGARVIG
jgi:hypothetical protein